MYAYGNKLASSVLGMPKSTPSILGFPIVGKGIGGIPKRILVVPSQLVFTVPKGVEFDGVTDYLSRSTDLVGNVDSKTFTFSCWVYATAANQYIYFSMPSDTVIGFYIQVQYVAGSGMKVQVAGYNSAGTSILLGTTTTYFAINTNTHICGSIDLSNVVNRSIYINDILATTTWSMYTNDFINTTNTINSISSYSLNATRYYSKGRLSNVFLAYEYVDLSIESNRRMFITSDGKPA